SGYNSSSSSVILWSCLASSRVGASMTVCGQSFLSSILYMSGSRNAWDLPLPVSDWATTLPPLRIFGITRSWMSVRGVILILSMAFSIVSSKFNLLKALLIVSPDFYNKLEFNYNRNRPVMLLFNESDSEMILKHSDIGYNAR